MGEARHGGAVWKAARELGLPPESILDFSANLNPAGPPPGVEVALREAASRISAYPDSEAPALRRLLCARHGAPEECLVLGAGGVSLLFLALRALSPRRVLLPEPCFSEQPRALRACGAEQVSLRFGDHLGLEALAGALPGCDAALLTNPHNPTGQLLSRNDLAPWIRGNEGLALLVDEAFMDYAPGESLLPKVLARPRTVILRSLTKFYAMPGLRVGYAFADPATATRMRELQEAWPLGQPEILAAEAALRDSAYEAGTLQAFTRDAPLWGAQLGCLPGVKVSSSAAPFFLLELPGPIGTALAERLHGEGILVRTCADWPGLDDRFLRVAVKDAEAHARLLPRLKAHLEAMTEDRGLRPV